MFTHFSAACLTPVRVGVTLIFCCLFGVCAEAQISLERLATGLLNPRGVVVLSPHDLIVVEAGSGDVTKADGRISRFLDVNRDGDFDDEGERIILRGNLPSYNGLYAFGTGHDEVGGAGDALQVNDGLVFTMDTPRAGYLADGSESDIYIQELALDGEQGEVLLKRGVTLNSLSYDPNSHMFYVVESGNNSVTQFRKGEAFSYLTSFLPLEHGQQAVPAGITLEPSTGDVLVALFSGQVYDGNSFYSYQPGDSKVVRVTTATGEQRDEITGLTTAVDVAVDEAGTIFVLEFTHGQALEKLSANFLVADPDSPPLPGGYPRQRGRLTMFPKGGEAVLLLEHVDAPTNLTYAHNALYISTGQGTPGRPVLTPEGNMMVITGELYRVTNWPKAR